MQELKDKHGKLLRMGLYDLSNRNKNGMALNEAAVQLMASLANKTEKDTVKYYNMEFTTESPDFYPIETALIKQMIYFTGSYPLFHSTLFSNDIFKNTFISKSSASTYNKIEYNFDLLMHYQEELGLASYKLSNMSEDKKISKVRKLNEKINVLKEVILNKTLEIQKIILTECFNKEFSLIRNADDINLFKARLNNFSSALITNENDTTYTDYCSEMMLKLADKKAGKAAQAPQQAPAPAPVVEAAPETDDLELIAVITAAIHAYEEAQGNAVSGDLVVRSIKKRNSRWQNA